ncbi:TonB-dependent receptor [Sphingomonas koreensis]|nr:TonB-dependent receptor [Sphingomonas koreensis]
MRVVCRSPTGPKFASKGGNMSHKLPIRRQIGALSAAGLVAIMLTGGFADVAHAQATADQPQSNDTQGVQDIIVTAGKRSEKLSDVGGAVSAISGDDLRKMNASKITDYFGFIPGVSLTSYGRPGQVQVAIRGISSQSVGSSTAVYVDEIPFGQSSNESQGAAYLPDLDPSDLERVEVLKGPQGTLYGASSLGGLVKYVTRPASLDHTEFETGEDVNVVDHGDVGIKFRAAGTTPIIKDVLGIRVSGYYRRDPGFVDNVYLGENNVDRGHSYGGRVALLFQPIEKLQIKLGAILQNNHAKSMSEVDYDVPPPFIPTYGDLNNERYIDQPSYVNNRIYSAEIHYDFGPVNLISATGVTRQRIDRVLDITQSYGVRYARYLHTVPGDGNTIDLNAGYNIDKVTQEVRLQSRENGHFEWVIGGFYQDEGSTDLSVATLRNPQGVIAPDPIGHPIGTSSDNDLKEYAGFAHATLYLLPNLDVSAGYRHSNIDQRNDKLSTGIIYNGPTDPAFDITRVDVAHDHVNTYSFGARWRPTSRLLFYARAASGFRPGGGRTLPPAAQAIGLSPVYQPDRVWSYEAGVKASALGNRLSVDLDGFWIDWKDIQNLQLIETFYVAGNAGNARSRGLEAEVQFEPIDRLNLTGSFAYTDAIYTEGNVAADVAKGDELTAVAKYTASLRGEYDAPINDRWHGFVGGDFQYRSSEFDVVATRLPSYTLFGLHAGVESDNLRVQVYASNLTDKRGLLGTTTGSTSYAVVQPRTIGISLTQKWH